MTENLKDWYINYRKHKDIFYGRIAEFEEMNGVVLIKNKDSTVEKTVVMENMHSYISLLSSVPSTEKITIVTLNMHQNVNLMLAEWKKIVEYLDLTIMFVNPNSVQDKKWMIKPHVHDGIMDGEVLKEGIMSIASGVDFC